MRVAVLSVALSLALFASPGWAQQASPAAAPATADDPEANEAAVSKVPLDEIRRFVAVYNAVKQAYVDPVEDKKLMHAAVRGLLSDLDPHSTYFDKEDAEAFDEQATGAYDGIGVELLQQQDNTLKVIAPIDDTPAARAGVKAGDVIVAIDGKPIDASKAMEPLRGESGSKVTLTIVRDKVAKPFDITLQRETIRVASVRSKLLEPGYGYIRISTFQADTGADFQKNLKQLQAGGKLRGLVLDLRSNPGGLLTSAVQVADDLLDKGNIVSTRGRISISDAKFDATPGDLSAVRRWWCWWTRARRARRKCWPARCATTSARASSAAAPSARARCRPCCRWTTATRSSSPPRAITRPAASRSRPAASCPK